MKNSLWLSVGLLISGGLILLLGAAEKSGLYLFAWTPVFAAWVAWEWLKNRDTTRKTSSKNLDRELQELLKGSTK